MHDGTDGVGLGYHGRNQKPATYRKWVCEMRYTQKKNGVASLPREDCHHYYHFGIHGPILTHIEKTTSFEA